MLCLFKNPLMILNVRMILSEISLSLDNQSTFLVLKCVRLKTMEFDIIMLIVAGDHYIFPAQSYIFNIAAWHISNLKFWILFISILKLKQLTSYCFVYSNHTIVDPLSILWKLKMGVDIILLRPLSFKE